MEKLWEYRTNMQVILISLCLVVGALAGGYAYFEEMQGKRALVEGNDGAFRNKFKVLFEGKIPLNLQERLDDWTTFGRGIVESKTNFLLGHPEPMPRAIRSSPHNWYVEMAYTFGIVSLLPILLLISYTAFLCYCLRRRVLLSRVGWLAAIVFYLVVIDANFKVTLRQPYPGIFAYFMWGMLLSRLRLLRSPATVA